MGKVTQLLTHYAIMKTAVNNVEWACAIRDTKKEADEMADALNKGDKIGEKFWVMVTRSTYDESMPDVDSADSIDYEISEADEELTDDDYPPVPA